MELNVAMTTIEPVPDKQVENLSAPIIRHHRRRICSKQNGLKVATTTTTNVALDQQAEDMMTPAVRHHSGHICSKQGELKSVMNTIKTETNSKLTGKTTNTSTLPVGRTSQRTDDIVRTQPTTSTGMIIHPSGRPSQSRTLITHIQI